MNDGDRDIEEADKVEDLTKTLKQLEITVSRLKERRNILVQRRNKRTSGRDSTRRAGNKRELQIGDLVEVKDNYKGRKGVIGRTASLHGGQVRLETIDGSAGFRKFKENVRLIEE